MKKLTTILALAFIWPALLAEAELLTIKVAGIKVFGGKLMLAVCSDSESFADVEGAVLKQEIPLTLEEPFDQIKYQADLPCGQYAIKVFHDINSNDKLDRNWLGKPVEPWGVTNNVRPFLRAPSFKESLFTFDRTKTTITVELE